MAAGMRISLLVSSLLPPKSGISSRVVAMLMGCMKVPCMPRRCGCRQGSLAAVKLRTKPSGAYDGFQGSGNSGRPERSGSDGTLREGESGGQAAPVRFQKMAVLCSHSGSYDLPAASVVPLPLPLTRRGMYAVLVALTGVIRR